MMMQQGATISKPNRAMMIESSSNCRNEAIKAFGLLGWLLLFMNLLTEWSINMSINSSIGDTYVQQKQTNTNTNTIVEKKASDASSINITLDSEVANTFNNTRTELTSKEEEEKAEATEEPEERSCLPLNSLWCPRGYESCYRKGGDWTNCAGDHLLYPPSTPAQLKERGKFMCLYQPLCWLQLDWETRDPPAVDCPTQQQFQFVDWSLHDGTMASTTSTLRNSKFQQSITNCNYKKSKGAMRNYNTKLDNCPIGPRTMQKKWSDWPRSIDKHRAAKGFWKWGKTDIELAQRADVHMVSFVPSMFEALMAMNKTILLNFMHRPDLFRCSTQAGKDNFNNIRRLASSGAQGSLKDGPLHIVAPGYIHEVEYVRHYTGLQPIYLPVSLLELMPKQQDYTGSRETTYIWNAHRGVPGELLASNFEFWSPTAYKLTDLLDYRGVVHMPYSVTNMKILEQYELNIPIFAPTPQFAQQLHLFDDRTATYHPYCPDLKNDQHTPAHPSSPYEFSPNARDEYGDNAQDELFWIQFAEIYRWPCIQYFDSWQQLLELLNSTNTEQLQQTSQCMKQANKWRKFEVDSNVCWILEQLSKPENNVQNRTLQADLDYQQTLQALYGTDALFTA